MRKSLRVYALVFSSLVSGVAGARQAEVRQESRELTRLRTIASELRPLEGRIDRASLSRKSGLLAELVELDRRDVRDVRIARC